MDCDGGFLTLCCYISTVNGISMFLVFDVLSLCRCRDINPLEKARLERAQADKKKKLQNPLFFVSPVR